MKKINVVCLKWGTKYSSTYVNRLFKMVNKNLTYPFDFFCLTDNPEALDEGIRVLPISDPSLSGWWHKLSLFQADFYGLTGTALYLDLDVVITGELDSLIDFRPGEFCIMKDTGRQKWDKFNSSVMRFELGSMSYVWEGFLFNRNWIFEHMYGDQDWISLMVPNGVTYPEDLVVSFKKHCHAQGWSMLGLGEWLMKREWLHPSGIARIPNGARVIVFHGLPNPEDVMEKPYKQWRKAPWIRKYWMQ